MKTFARVIATSFGFGYAPIAPGTMGAVFGVLIYYLLIMLTPESIDLWLLILIGLGYVGGVWSCNQLQEEWGDDPSRVVMDETIGVWITLLFIPYQHIWIWLAFGLFRLFDILKPLGIKAIDKQIKNSHGVMLDDVLSGIYAWLALQGFIQISYLMA